jgi:predicted GNAT family N-acyltransferase
MGFRIKVAETAEEIDAVFRFRHAVYVAEEGYFSARDDQRIFDRYDALPTTLHIIAVRDGNIVGTLRFVESSAAGTPTDEVFYFAPHLPSGVHTAAGGMLCVAREHRRVAGLCTSLVGIGFYWCERQRVSHVLAICNALHQGLFCHLGFRPVGGLTSLPDVTTPVIPMVLNMSDLNPEQRDFNRRQSTSPWPGALSVAVFAENETIASRGKPADAAYSIVKGTARVLARGSYGSGSSYELGPGDVFGVEALLDHETYPGTLVAQTRCELVMIGSSELIRGTGTKASEVLQRA